MAEVPHTLDAIRVSQHLANVFVDTARRSSHKAESKEEELALLIYDVPPTFSARFETFGEDNYDGPDITYYLDKRERPPSGADDTEDDDPYNSLRRAELAAHRAAMLQGRRRQQQPQQP